MVSNPLSGGAAAAPERGHEHTTMQILRFKVATLIDNEEEIAQFNEIIGAYQENHEIVPMVHGLKRIIKLPERLQLFDDVRRVVPLNQQMEYNLLVPYTSNRTRNVELQRRAPTYGFGFSIRGGREHGTGFFVSHVEVNSEAFFQGLKVGDQIVRINGFSVEFAIHREVLQLIQSSTHLYLRVRSVGMIPVKDGHLDDELSILLRYQRPTRVSLPASLNEGGSGRRVPPMLSKSGRSISLQQVTNKKHDSLSWKMVEDHRSVSPTGPMHRPLVRTQSEGSMLDKSYDDTRDIKLYVDVSNHTSLGVSICKANKQKYGIFIQSTRENSLAREAGFLAGDQIIECNGTNFEAIEFQEAVKILKESKQLDLVIRRGVGVEFFGESSGYNSSSSSVNGDHHTDAGKRLSLITEDPEDGERSRSNSRRDPDDTLTAVMEHPADTVDSKETVVKVQVHREPDEMYHGMNPLASSSSGSSLSSFSSAVSLEAKRRAEQRRDGDDNDSVTSQDKRRQREIAIKVLPVERREKHAQLMQEFQQVHSKMFSNGTKDYSKQERFGYSENGDSVLKVMQNGVKRSDSVEMPSLDNLTLSPTGNPIKPPAVYFGAKPGKSTPGVVTISEYPSSDRRSAPNKLDFLGGSSNGGGVHPDDPHGALATELHSALSRSNLRQLSEPMPTPPPPPLSPDLQGGYHSNHAKEREVEQHTETLRIEINGGAAADRSHPPPQMRRSRAKISAINALERARSPPPVIARKPIAIPYTELVNMSNQAPVEPVKIQVGPIETGPASPVPVHAPKNQAPQQYSSRQLSSPNQNGGKKTEMIMDALSNKVTIKFPNGKSASSAGVKGLDSMLASAPHTAANHGILKQGAAQQHKHKTVIQQKNITFGEITTMMTCIQIQDGNFEARV